MEPGRVDVNLPEHKRADAKPGGRLEGLDDGPFLEPLRRTLLPSLLLPVHDRGELRLEPGQPAGGNGIVVRAADDQPGRGFLFALLEGGFGSSGGLELGDVREGDLRKSESRALGIFQGWIRVVGGWSIFILHVAVVDRSRLRWIEEVVIGPLRHCLKAQTGELVLGGTSGGACAGLALLKAALLLMLSEVTGRQRSSIDSTLLLAL